MAAIVTGAGRGIGRATAVLLAKEGAALVLASRTQSELEETAERCRSHGAEALVCTADVTLEADCDRLVAACCGAHGRADILVNNAGGAVFKPVWELSLDEFNRNVDVNLRSVFLCSRAAIRAMLPRRSGTIVNVASSSGKKPYLHQGAYCASKAGVLLLSKVMAMELREHGIRVHVVCPGGVATRLADEIHPTRDKTGWIQPEDVAETIVHLLRLSEHVSVDEVAIRRFEAEPM